MHTDTTLGHLETVTTSLCNELRKFQKNTCAEFETKETEKEYRTRQRSNTRRQAQSGNAKAAGLTSHGRKHKTFSLSTYKLHVLPDLPRYIRLHGAAPGFSTRYVSWGRHSISFRPLTVPHRGRPNTSAARIATIRPTRTTLFLKSLLKNVARPI